MPRFTVYARAWTDLSVHVAAEDYDAAIEAAYEEQPSGLCAQCSGWGETWSKGEGDYEPYEVADENGKTVWSDKAVD